MGLQHDQRRSSDRAHLESVDYASGWLNARGGGDPSVELLVHPLLHRLVGAAIERGAHRLLDAGCGDGVRSSFLLACFPTLSIAGGDFNDDLVARASRAVPRGNFQKIDLGTTLPFENSSFDTFICVNVLMHLDDQQISRAAQEAARVLDSAGQVLFVTVHSDWARNMRYPPGSRGASWKLRTDIPGGAHEENYPSDDRLAELLSVRGTVSESNRLVIPQRAAYIQAGYPDDSRLDRHCAHAGTALFSCVTLTKK